VNAAALARMEEPRRAGSSPVFVDPHDANDALVDRWSD
jgi:hypothetical protein